MLDKDVLVDLAARARAQAGLVPMDGGSLGIFDPALAAQADAENYRSLVIPESLAGILGGGKHEPVYWDEVRAPLLAAIKRLNGSVALKALYGRMQALMDKTVGGEADLTWLIERTISQTLIPLIVADLDQRGMRAVIRDQDTKLANLLTTEVFTWSKQVRDAIVATAAGNAVGRSVRRRVRGESPPCDDLAQAVLPLHDRLGPSRTTYAITTVLTAVAGAPGSVAACLMFELLTRPEWRERIHEELAGVSVDQLCASPLRHTPLTYRFIREVLRLWTFPPLARRNVLKDFQVGQAQLKAGQGYWVSSYITHHSPDLWTDPEAFNPDRWSSEHRNVPQGGYVPFGWAPRTCIGSSLGLSQLIILCHILLSQFDVEVLDAASAEIRIDGIAFPKGFRGVLTPRP